MQFKASRYSRLPAHCTIGRTTKHGMASVQEKIRFIRQRFRHVCSVATKLQVLRSTSPALTRWFDRERKMAEIVMWHFYYLIADFVQQNRHLSVGGWLCFSRPNVVRMHYWHTSTDIRESIARVPSQTNRSDLCGEKWIGISSPWPRRLAKSPPTASQNEAQNEILLFRR